MKEFKEEDYLLLSGIQHYAVCQRRWALIHLENQWVENYHTAFGRILHNKVHDMTSFEKRGDILILRAQKVASKLLGLSGECDVVEFHRCPNGILLNNYSGRWIPYPIEYKKGAGKSLDADSFQLCAEAICLEEMLSCRIPKGALYYGNTKRRTEVNFTEELRKNVLDAAIKMHNLFDSKVTPASFLNSHICKACSLKDVCVPAISKKRNKIKEYIDEVLINEKAT